MQPAADVRGLTLRTLMPGFAGTDVPAWLEKALADGLPSVCLYGSNVAQPRPAAGPVRATSADRPRTCCWQSTRRAATSRVCTTGPARPTRAMPCSAGSTMSSSPARSATGSAQDLADVGVNLDLAPVVDVNSAPTNPVIGTRSFGADADLVARHSAAWVEGLQSTGIAACAKHFPGHGDTTADSHRTLPVVDGFRRCGPGARAGAVRRGRRERGLVRHDRRGRRPVDRPGEPGDVLAARSCTASCGSSSASDGVIVTDALDMAGASHDTGIPEAAVRALAAGCDLLCLGPDTDEGTFEAVIAAVGGALDQGRLSLERLTAAADAVTSWPTDSRGRVPATSRPTMPRSLLRSRSGSPMPPEHGVPGSGPAAIVQIETEANDAVGHSPWGPDALGLASDERAVATCRLAWRSWAATSVRTSGAGPGS